jgi:hypothetical protein
MSSTVKLAENAKTVANGIKLLCASCRTVQIKLDGNKMTFAQESDNKAAWIELVLTLTKPVEKQQPLRIVDSKALAAIVRGITTLKDTMEITIGEDTMLVVVTITKAASGSVENVSSLQYQNEQGSRFDTRPCSAEKLVAGRVDLGTRELDAALKSAPELMIKVSGGKVSFGDVEMDKFATTTGPDYTSRFVSETLSAFVKPSLAPNVAFHLYRDLPLKLMYSLAARKGKKASVDSDDVLSATMQIFHS